VPGVASEWTARAGEHQKIGIPYPGLSLEMCPYQQSVPGTWMAVAVAIAHPLQAAVEEAMASIQVTVVVVDTLVAVA
jgi:hypothetical protein